MDWNQATSEAVNQIYKQVGEAVKEQTQEARQLAPVDTGRLQSDWKSSGYGKHYRIENMTNYAAFIEFGTRNQPGREMLGMRSDRVGQDIVNKTLRHRF